MARDPLLVQLDHLRGEILRWRDEAHHWRAAYRRVRAELDEVRSKLRDQQRVEDRSGPGGR